MRPLDLGEASVELLKAVIRKTGYPPHVADTAEYRALYARLEREVAELPPGVTPEIPWDYNSPPDPAPVGPPGGGGGLSAEALNFSKAVELELGWRFNPAEKRNERGEWTRGGAAYTVPDHERLIMPHPPKNSRFPYYRAPEDHPFFRAHPVSAANVLKVYDASTEAERAQGMRWYADAHTLATAIGHGDTAKGAGLLAAYSPQTAWPANMFNAAHAVELGRALGPGDGMITHAMQANAQEVLDGEPLDTVFGKNRAPKIRAFAHLIANGGDSPDDTTGNVVIDRHAMSAAMGVRLPKVDADKAPIGTDRYYQHVADAYRAAAAEATRRGTPISPHQMQAITWLHQQAANQAEDDAGAVGHGGKGAGRGRRVMAKNAWLKWNAEAASEHFPVTVGTTALTGLAEEAAVLELAAAGWRDAWRHELRGPHGEWERSAAAAGKEVPEGSYSLRLAPDGLPNPSPESLALARTMVQPEGTTAVQREAIARVLGDNLDNIPPQMREAMARTHKVRLGMDEEDNPTGGVLGVTGAWKGSWEIRIRPDVMTDEQDQSVTDSEDEGNFVRTDGAQKYRALRHVVTHEFGHALFELGLIETGDIYEAPGSDDAYQKYGALAAREKTADDMLGALGGPTLANSDKQRAKFMHAMKSLSMYGASSIDEAIAESYTAFALSGKGADGSVKARSAGRDFLIDAERTFASSPAGTGMELNLAAPGDVPYRGCSGLPASPADFERLYGTPEAKAAAARAWGLTVALAGGTISSQILDMSWRDAWRHEARGPHGEWERGATAAGLTGADRSHIASSLGWLRDEARRHIREDETQHVSDAIGALNQGLDQYAAVLLKMAAQDARRRPSEGAQSRAEQYDNLADRIMPGQLAPDVAATKKFLDDSARVVPAMFGSDEKLDWDGKPPTVFADDAHPDYLADIGWDGHVEFSQSTAAGIRDGLAGTGPVANADAFTVPLHEMIHALLPPGQKRMTNGDKDAYQKPAGQKIEEGFTQLATNNHAADFFAKIGIGERPTEYAARDEHGGAVDDPAFAAAVTGFAGDLEAKAAELAADGRAPQAQAGRHLGTLASRLRADPMNADSELFDDDFMGALSEAQHLGDPGLATWAMGMKKRGLEIQKMPTDQHYTMAQYAAEMASPQRLANGTSWPHYPEWTADAWTWVSDIAQRMTGSDNPEAARRLADQISSVGTASKPRVMAEQLIIAAGLDRVEPPLTREQMDAARQSTVDEILNSWSKTTPQEAAARAASAFRNTVSTMRETAAREAA